MRLPAVALLAVLGLSACGGGGGPDAAVGASPAPSPSSSPSPTFAPSPSPAPSPSKGSAKSLDTAAIQSFLQQNYSDTPWIGRIVRVEDRVGAAFVETSLPPGSRDGSAICTAVSAYFFSNQYAGDARKDFPGIRVAAATGDRLSFRPSLGDKC
ncbi:hypothetical protein [Nocardioides sp.]|uniref:hypothetical protein n=1 Tax=Nocardioides sp. TaxID=35761 RepID=UPI002BC9DEF4|nr:hypothetical protein [Nocardioides sp.]HXH79944.1 hypothetical protein [Nocardioides sp.]